MDMEIKIWEPAEITALYGNRIKGIELGMIDNDFVNNLTTFRVSVNGKSVFGKIKTKYVNAFQVILK